jgi:predicted nucleotidyltransferase
METTHDKVTQHINVLKVSPAVKNGLDEFVSQVVGLYRDDLLSIAAFGSAVTGDYDAGQSDVNLLVVHSELEIGELGRVADLSRRWLRKEKFAPRFLSKRNLDESVRYFQIDFLSMRDAHVVLWGQDVLAGIELYPSELRWQVAYEIKAMRMRIKQQYWRTANEPRLMRSVLVERFTSLVHLMRALLLLYNAPGPVMRREIIDAAAATLGIDKSVADELLDLRRSPPPDQATLNRLFEGLMDIIRTLDSRVDSLVEGAK